MRNEQSLSRRDAVATAVAALLPVRLLGNPRQDRDQQPGELQNPNMAGLPRARITDYENDPFIVELESRLACTCGCTLDVYTCRTTDFTCGVSPAMHREVVELVQQGRTAEEIIEAFVAEYGETVLMAPPKDGFNLLGYVLPGLGILGVGAAMSWLLLNRSRGDAQLAPVRTGASHNTHAISAEESALIERELADLDL